jgi:hypothetical protein
MEGAMLILMRVRGDKIESIPVRLPRRPTPEEQQAILERIRGELETLMKDFEPGCLGDLDADDPDES